MTKVKICGITDLEDARLAAKLGADMLGFNFYKNSLRFVEPEKAHDIISQLSVSVEKVGVFVNESQERILEIVKQAGLDSVQLHGDEDEDFIVKLSKLKAVPIIRAFRVSSSLAFDEAVNSTATFVLLDGYSESYFGGTGITFDWSLAQEVTTILPKAVFLAGGLTAENVRQAVKTVRPYAVDVASGVESSPGKKDPKKLAAFIKAAKEAI